MTLIEIMVVVMIIGLLCAIAFPAWSRMRSTSLITLLVSDLRVASMALVQYPFTHNGAYPPEAAAGVVPEGLEVDLRRMKWAEPTPVGGSWDWNATNVSIDIIGSKSDESAFREIDTRIDDGNLLTGLFQKKGDDYAYSVIE